MEISVIKKGYASVVNVSGKMDASTAPQFDEACDKLLQENERNLVLNMAALEYISSAGLRSILALGKKIKTAGGQLLLCCLEGMVKEVFEISGFASMFKFFPSQEKALEQLR